MGMSGLDDYAGRSNPGYFYEGVTTLIFTSGTQVGYYS